MNSESKRLVKAALELDRLSLNYQITMKPDGAVEFLRRCTLQTVSNNEWVSLVQDINKLIPPMQYGPGNPSNGQPHHVFRIGNEYSRVIYLVIAKLYISSLNPLDWNTLGDKLKALGKAYCADEVDEITNDGREYVFRFWWD